MSENANNTLKEYLNSNDPELIKSYITVYIEELNITLDKLRIAYNACATVNEAVEKNGHVRMQLGQFIGYNWGLLYSAIADIETCVANLERIRDKYLDDHPPASSAISSIIWYQLGEAKTKEAYEAIKNIEMLESQLIEYSVDEETKLTNVSLNRYMM